MMMDNETTTRGDEARKTADGQRKQIVLVRHTGMTIEKIQIFKIPVTSGVKRATRAHAYE
jgi:hypothetical protein